MINKPLTSEKTIIVDVDGVVANSLDGDYSNPEPLPHGIEQTNKLYDLGYYIIMFTARYGDREKGDINRQYQRGYVELFNWLVKHGVKFHEARLGKPPGIMYIDDKAARVDGDNEDGWEHVWDSLEMTKHKDRWGLWRTKTGGY